MLIAILSLMFLAACLSASLYLLKREIKSINRQLCGDSLGAEKPVELVLLDKDLTELAATINKNQARQKDNKLEILKRERSLKESVSNISHDLRTPLTSAIGYLQLLQKTEITREQREYVEISLSRSRYLQALINDFYDISLLETINDPPVLTRINLDQILTDAVLSFTEQLKDKKINPVVSFSEKPAYVMADETALKRMISNLVSNAIQYGTEELTISVMSAPPATHDLREAARCAKGDDFIRLDVKNTVRPGQSLDIGRLFDQFYTADTSRSQSGTGLGLYIVKVLSEKMHGHVSAGLENNKLTVSFSLPKAQP